MLSAMSRALVSSVMVDQSEFDCVACAARQAAARPVLRATGEARPFDLFRCRHCGMVQQFPRYSDAQIAALYGAGYYVHEESDAQRWARAVQQYVLHILPREGPGRRLLDIGCATGHLVALSKARGWEPVGLDVSPEAIRVATERFGIDARAGMLENLAGTLGRFDAVFLGDVIEHARDPGALMDHVGAVLRDGGEACIDTPNWNSRWRRLGRSGWLGLNRFHINLFGPESLRRLLASRGFRSVRLGSYTHFRYESFVARPEVQACMQWLPGRIGWRVNRYLSMHESRGAAWRALRVSPPADLRQASRAVDAMAGLARSTTFHSLKGDNLIAFARRET